MSNIFAFDWEGNRILEGDENLFFETPEGLVKLNHYDIENYFFQVFGEPQSLESLRKDWSESA